MYSQSIDCILGAARRITTARTAARRNKQLIAFYKLNKQPCGQTQPFAFGIIFAPPSVHVGFPPQFSLSLSFVSASASLARCFSFSCGGFIFKYPARLREYLIELRMSGSFSSTIGCLAIKISLHPGFMQGISGVTASRIRRFVLLRTTALPIFLLTEKPILTSPCLPLA